MYSEDEPRSSETDSEPLLRSASSAARFGSVRSSVPAAGRAVTVLLAIALAVIVLTPVLSSSGLVFLRERQEGGQLQLFEGSQSPAHDLDGARKLVEESERLQDADEGVAKVPTATAAQPASSTHHEPITHDAVLDTRPATPSLLPRPKRERYIAYLPHSGLHNQRIELQNALLLAHLTNRTLLIPLARLGRALPWKHFDLLTSLWHRQQKSSLTRCRALLPQLEAHGDVKDLDCKGYATYTQVSWQFLVDFNQLRVPVRLIERDNLDRAWLSAQDGLNVSRYSIHSFEDPYRYSWRLYDDRKSTKDKEQYKNRLNVEDLLESPYSDSEVLEFGSLFGSSRWILSKPENRKKLDDIEASLFFSIPLLDEVANAIEEQMGGRGSFIGLHLRVGDGGFKRVAVKSMQNVFRQLCTRILRLPEHEVEGLIAASREAHDHSARRSITSAVASAPWSSFDGTDWDANDEEPVSHIEPGRLQKRDAGAMTCKGALHANATLLPLNARTYVATDSPAPDHDRALAPFRYALPCLYFLSDFRETVPELSALADLRSEQDGVKVAPLLMPLLEAMIAARGRVVIGTKGSTMSRAVTKLLHDHYWPPFRHRPRKSMSKHA